MSEITWPKIITTEIPETPEEVMASFARALSVQTNNVLKGAISTRSGNGIVASDFQIIAPLFNNYRYELFSTTHGVVPIYPVTVVFDFVRTSCKNGSEFKSRLNTIINDKSTKEIIMSLIAQSGKEGYDALKNSSLTAA